MSEQRNVRPIVAGNDNFTNRANEGNELNRMLKDVQLAIDDFNNQPNKRISEDYFRRIYLPLFTNIPEEKMNVKVSKADWFGVSGGPNFAVDVVDKHGQVLFTVPPINSLHIRVMGETPRYSQVLQRAQEYGQNYPKQAENMWSSSLAKLAGSEDLNAREEVMLAWARIFGFYGFLANVEPVIDVASYYGISPRQNGAKPATTVKQEETASLDDTIIWDE